MVSKEKCVTDIILLLTQNKISLFFFYYYFNDYKRQQITPKSELNWEIADFRYIISYYSMVKAPQMLIWYKKKIKYMYLR